MTNLAKLLFVLFLFFFSASYGQQSEIGSLPEATVEGHLKAIYTEYNRTINLGFIDPIFGKVQSFEVEPDSLGYFNLSVPIVFPAIGVISSSSFSPVIVSLAPNRTVKLDVSLYGNDYGIVELDDDFEVSMHERLYWYFLLKNILDDNPTTMGIDTFLTPNEYRDIVLKNMSDVLFLADSDKRLSDVGKALLKKEIELYFVNDALMNYESFMSDLKNRNELRNVEIPEPDLSYYSFLKDLNLSDTASIRSQIYSDLMGSILDDLPLFNDLTPSVWIASVKPQLDSVVGDNQDLFYDLLIANLYGKQIREWKSLSEQQIEDIRSYYKDNNIAKMLLYENEQMNELLLDGLELQKYIEDPTDDIEKKEPSY